MLKLWRVVCRKCEESGAVGMASAGAAAADGALGAQASGWD